MKTRLDIGFLSWAFIDLGVFFHITIPLIGMGPETYAILYFLLGTKTGKFLPGEQFGKITPAQNITQRNVKGHSNFPNYASLLFESGSI